MAQTTNNFTIKGKLGNLNAPARAYLLYKEGANQIVDSALIANGNFTIQGNILNPVNGGLVIDHKGVGLAQLDSAADVLTLYIDKGTTTITGPDSVSKATISGSKINDENKLLNSQLKPINDKAKKLAAMKNAATSQSSADFKGSLQAQYKALQNEQKSVIKKFIIEHPDSYLSLTSLYYVDGPSPNPAELDSLYNLLSPDLKATETAKNFRTALEPLRHTAPGVMAPDFTQNDVNGNPVKLSSFRGKYVLVDFWASWCPPCREENPNVVKAYNKYKDKNFTILGVSLDRPTGKADWLAAIKSDGLAWTQVSDLKYWNNEAAAMYYVTSIPANFLIGPDGKIIARNLRGDDLDAKLNELLVK